ncbi:hypothetical protein CAEBREN_01612 [Caenorhabditis brenneri]|uniref:Uncharacterized protein n=1 Tax=Caenorhabditis brenneri TaxID=135651 RepID=G0NPK2_CAEBE|nr:hypothetical protein CAEBREN_01612 [Caenorhabditis brenneri]
MTTDCVQPDDSRMYVLLLALTVLLFINVLSLEKKKAMLRQMFIDVQLELNAVYDSMDEGLVFVPKEKRNNKYGWMLK